MRCNQSCKEEHAYETTSKYNCIRCTDRLYALYTVGCSSDSDGEASEAQKLSGSFTADMTMIIDDLNTVGTISRISNGEWSTAFSEPSSLAGIILDFSDGTVNASYQGLAFSVPQSALPVKSVLNQFILVVDALAQQEKITGTLSDGQIEVSGEWEGSPYLLTLTKNGALSKFTMDNMDAFLEFSQFQSGAAVATATIALTEAS